MLKQSPLAQDNVAIEEVAMWLDMTVFKTSDLIRMFKSIEACYHAKDDRVYDSNALLAQVLRNSMYGMQSSQSTRIFPFAGILEYWSDRILKNLFKAIAQTDVLDKHVLSEKFVSYVEKAKDKHKRNIHSSKKLGDIEIPLVNRLEENLYEVFAELVDILEDKLTKRSRSLPS